MEEGRLLAEQNRSDSFKQPRALPEHRVARAVLDSDPIIRSGKGTALASRRHIQALMTPIELQGPLR